MMSYELRVVEPNKGLFTSNKRMTNGPSKPTVQLLNTHIFDPAERLTHALLFSGGQFQGQVTD